ncbi:SDR family NAD(P)-dependent oxidoreductase [archaeon]|nr:MAG: SDR family NAD(P)-dependent oxidoreductase [archaeon]
MGLVHTFLMRCNNCKVIATCRDVDSASDLHNLQRQFRDRVIPLCLDVTRDEQFDQVKQRIQEMGINTIDVLINNAAISNEEHPHDHVLTCRREELVEVFNTNVGGYMKLFQVFSDMLCNSQLRIAFVLSSRLGSLSGASSEGGTTAYRISKAGINMLSVLFAQDGKIKESGVKVILNHPGHVDTYLGKTGGQQPKISVEQSANSIVDLIECAASVQLSQTQSGGKDNLGFQPSLEEISNRQDFQQFKQILQSDNKVFVNYDGSILPF